MKRRRWIATVLAVVLGCGSVGSVAMADTPEKKSEFGWKLENEKWSYYDNDRTQVKNDFRLSGSPEEGWWVPYYLGEDGHLVLVEGGSTITTFDGSEYELTAGGTLVGGSLYIAQDGDEISYQYTEPESGRLAKEWRRIKDENGKLHWYFFDQKQGEYNGITRAITGGVKGISKYEDGTWKVYHFNEEGQMAESELIQYNRNGSNYGIYAEVSGLLVRDKWLYINDNWHYFENTIFDDMEFGVMATSDTVINGIDYSFDENGYLVSDNAPYANIEDIELSTDKESVYVGDTVSIKADFTLASTSNASAEVATGSNATVKAIMEEQAYDVIIIAEQDGRGIASWEFKVDKKLSEDTDFINYSYKTTMEGEITITMMVDGVESNSISVDCVYNSDKTETSSYMKTIFDGILSSGLPAQEIIGKTANVYRGLEKGVVSRIRENDAIVKALADFEKLYLKGQGMKTLYTEDFTNVRNVVDITKIEVVGAFLNTDFSGNQVVMAMEQKAVPSEILGLEGEKKTALDISLSGGVGDTSNLEIPVTITMPVPKGFSNVGLKLYHIENGQATELLLGKDQLKKSIVRFTTNGFSDFVFTGTPKSNGGSSGGSGGGSGSSSTSGKTSSSLIPQTQGSWKATEQGWQFIKVDGTPYVNEWLYVGSAWYYVDANGRMVEGWQTINGKWYYLTPTSGSMALGWQLVNEMWYYLSADGSMLANTKTPDGYNVNESGAWVQ